MRNVRKYFRYVIYLIVLMGYSNAIAGSYEEFLTAIKRDHGHTITALLSRGFDPNTPDEQGQPGVVLALRIESFKAAQALIESPQLALDVPSPAGETVLMMASLRGQRSMVEALLKRGAAINRPGWSALHYAASGPDDAALRLLLSQGADIDARSPNGTTPLMMAAQYGPWSCVEALLAAGARGELQNDLGLTATDFARRGGRDALAAALTKRASAN